MTHERFQRSHVTFSRFLTTVRHNSHQQQLQDISDKRGSLGKEHSSRHQGLLHVFYGRAGLQQQTSCSSPGLGGQPAYYVQKEASTLPTQ